MSLICRLFGHDWLPMTGRRVWVPIECARCGFKVGPPTTTMFFDFTTGEVTSQ